MEPGQCLRVPPGGARRIPIRGAFHEISYTIYLSQTPESLSLAQKVLLRAQVYCYMSSTFACSQFYDPSLAPENQVHRSSSSTIMIETVHRSSSSIITIMIETVQDMFMTPLCQQHASHALASRAHGPQPHMRS